MKYHTSIQLISFSLFYFFFEKLSCQEREKGDREIRLFGKGKRIQLTPTLGQVEPQHHFPLRRHIFTGLCHGCIVIILIDILK